MDLDTLLADLANCRDSLLRTAIDAQHEAEIVAAEIAGIEKARAILAPVVGNGAEPPKKERRERRDITALVKQALADFPGQTSPDMIAQQINCRVSQVKNALARINARENAQ